jgi:hypothetical protein
MRKTKQIAVGAQKRAVKTRVARVSSASKLQQDLIDERVIAEADDPSAWGPPVDVKRRGRSVALSASLARRAAFLARLHREQNLDTWLERIVRERVELEERAFNDARRRMGAKRPV